MAFVRDFSSPRSQGGAAAVGAAAAPGRDENPAGEGSAFAGFPLDGTPDEWGPTHPGTAKIQDDEAQWQGHRFFPFFAAFFFFFFAFLAGLAFAQPVTVIGVTW